MDIVFKILSLLVIVISIVLFIVDRKKFYKFNFVMLLLFPKVNLLSVGGSTTGIRYDDFLILLFLILSFADICEALRNSHKLAVLHAVVIMWAVFGLMSTVIGYLIGTVNSPIVSVLTSVRKYEYFICIFVGYFYFKSYGRKNLLLTIKISSLILMVLCVLQFFGFVGGFVAGTYNAELGFPIGVFNGAYEYACISCVFLAIFLYDAFKRSPVSYLFCLVALLQIVLSQSRTGLMLAVVLVLLMSFRYSKSIFLLAVVLGVVAIVGLKNTTTLLDRFASIDVKRMYQVMVERFASGDYYAALEELPTEYMYPNITTDLSFYVRTTKWGAAFDGFRLNPLVGYGPGQLSVLDGSYVKILCEGGIISALIFFALLVVLFKTYKDNKCPTCMWILFVLLCFALFIDIFDSSKNMQILWLFTGFSLVSEKYKVKVNDQVLVCRTVSCI